MAKLQRKTLTVETWQSTVTLVSGVTGTITRTNEPDQMCGLFADEFGQPDGHAQVEWSLRGRDTVVLDDYRRVPKTSIVSWTEPRKIAEERQDWLLARTQGWRLHRKES